MTSSPPIELRAITRENFRQCIALSVADEQREFVASNLYSLAEAKADGVSVPLAVYAGEVMVGFTMYRFEAQSGTGHIDRLMVAKEHQGHGYGRAAMLEVVRRLRDTPGCTRAVTSFVPSNAVADALYASLGFRRTGEVDYGETVVALEFSEANGDSAGAA
jgi:diamine N-acetyltransferase